MILENNIKIISQKGNTRIIKKIFNIDKVEMNRTYIIPIEKLSIDSHYKIKVKCDFCDYEREIPYRQYLSNIKKDGKYYCSKCSVTKMKDSKIEKYGNNYFDVVKKYKDTMMFLYGVENGFQLDEIKEKSKKTKFKKYGDEMFVNIKKHKETIMILYGIDNISKLDSIKQKKVETCLKNWGVEYPSQNKELSIKGSETRNRNRPYDLTKMIEYRAKVISLTLKNKPMLLENWDGYDYYDNEHIVNNFNLSSSDRNYPTIDHKISIFYCFMNSISVEDAAHIDNLCMTKKCVNSRKNRKNEADFKQI